MYAKHSTLLAMAAATTVAVATGGMTSGVPGLHAEAAAAGVRAGTTLGLVGQGGSRIVFVRRARDARAEELYLVNPDGSRLRRLTHNDVPDIGPVWSPDGRSIAWTRGTTLGDSVVMVTDGRDEWQVGAGTAPAWSPDGRQIAYTHWGTNAGEVEVTAADGQDGRRLAAGHDPAWSPDGSRIVFARDVGRSGSAVLVMSESGEDVSRVRYDKSSADTSPVWSPDGRRVAYTRHWDVDMDDIVVTTLAGRIVLERSGYGPVWSPDARRIAFSVEGAVRLMSVDGGHRVKIHGSHPAWSPDGRRILYIGARGLRTVRTNGTHDRLVARRGQPLADPAWFGRSPTRITVNAGPEPVAAGAPLKLTGRMTKVGVPLPDAAVTIRFNPRGSGRTATIARTATGPAGRYALVVTARRSGTWKAVHRATAATGGSKATDYVIVRR